MRSVLGFAVVFSSVIAASSFAQSPSSKQGGLPISPKTCDAPPPVVKDITTETVYRDPKRSVADAMIIDRNLRALAGLDRPLKTIIGWSSLYVAKKDVAAATCALTWLTAMARDGAMLGSVRGEQAEGDRKWRTAGIAVAYLKLKDKATPDQTAIIDPWLNTLATRIEDAEAKSKTINNRRYWAGLAATAVGFATGDIRHQQYGKEGIDQLDKNLGADGALLSELPRGQIAAHLHNYALAPLILSAEIAAKYGQDWYGDANAPIHRLAAFVGTVNADPSVITKITNSFQKQPSSGVLGWQAFYLKRFPNKVKPIKGATGPWEYSWLGGDLSGLAAAWVK